jgi:hypothetical protein
MIYDFDGKFVKKISLEGTWGMNVVTFDDINYYLVNDWSTSNKGCYRLFKIDTEHNRVFSYLPFLQKHYDNNRGWGLDKYYNYNGENKLLFFSTIDTIYSLGENDEINPLYAIDIVYNKIPENLKEGDGHIALRRAIDDKYVAGITDVAETSRFLYFDIGGGRYRVLYDKKEKKTLIAGSFRVPKWNTFSGSEWTTLTIEDVFSTEIKDLVLTSVTGGYAYNSGVYLASLKKTGDNRFDKAFIDVMNTLEDEEANPVIFVLKLKE